MKKRSFGGKRIAIKTTATANMDMMTIFIMTQNAPGVFPTGWRMKLVGEGYGEGYSLSAMCIWLLKTNLNIINSEYLNSGNPL